MLVKRYEYKVYSSSDEYIGVIDNVISEYSTAQDINTTGCSISIAANVKIDTAPEAVDPITDENGDPITDENESPFYIDRQPDTIGLSTSQALIKNGNIIRVYEFSKYHINGKKVFEGIINRWEADFNDQGDQIINITAISFGSDMDDFIIQDGL